jgi:ABC-type phosphate transport system substrate-binding protein
VITVQSTPALQPLAETYRGCVEEMENTGLVLLDTHAASIDLKQAGIGLRWGPGSAFTGQAFVVGQEALVIIVHPQNPLTSIDLSSLQAIFLGTQRNWPQSEPPAEIQPWVSLNGDDVQDVFQAVILAGQAPSARVVSQAPDPAAMREAVAANPEAIGFLPRRWLDTSVKAISIDGLDPALLQQPVLAVSQTEPQGADKSWLLCVQDRLSQ